MNADSLLANAERQHATAVEAYNIVTGTAVLTVLRAHRVCTLCAMKIIITRVLWNSSYYNFLYYVTGVAIHREKYLVVAMVTLHLLEVAFPLSRGQ